MANGERVMENGKFLVKAEFRVPCPGSIPISMAIPLAGNNMLALIGDMRCELAGQWQWQWQWSPGIDSIASLFIIVLLLLFLPPKP